MSKTWFITGSSRGLGRSITEAVLAKGDNVAATARNPKQLNDLVKKFPNQILALQLDVRDRVQIHKAVEQTVKHFGGRVGSAGFSMYQAAKFGLQGFTEVLSKEVATFGIKVTSIEPGGFRTDWASNSTTYAEPMDDYKNALQSLKDYLKDIMPLGNPDKAAQVIIDLVEHPEPPVHLVLGSDAVAILEVVDADRKAEFEKWKSVSISTDFDDVENPWLPEDRRQDILKVK